MASPQRQLVGSKCVLCQERIGSVMEGEHCAQCRHPVHNKCVKPESERGGDGLCALCGSPVTQAEVVQQVKEEKKRKNRALGGNYPVSVICPQCGQSEFVRRRPERWIAFAADRECKQCNTRYIPPTPTWAAVIFIILGFSSIGTAILRAFARISSGHQIELLGIVLDVISLLIGIPFIVYGFRCLQDPATAK